MTGKQTIGERGERLENQYLRIDTMIALHGDNSRDEFPSRGYMLERARARALETILKTMEEFSWNAAIV